LFVENNQRKEEFESSSNVVRMGDVKGVPTKN